MRSSALLVVSLHALGAVTLPLTATDIASSPAPTSELLPSTKEAPQTYDWQAGYVSQFTIHPSCNSTERREITEGLRQAVEMAEHAKNHILVHGSKSEIYQKYFGRGATGTPIGWFDKLASGNRAGIVFRCDDPDRNCETQNKWGGHWRGSNASSETVICQLSFQTRLPSTAMCARGFDVATGRPANFWGPDLMHRLYHVPLIGEGIVEHYADGYDGVQDLARGNNYTWAGSNSATLTYFATEVYAFDIAVPGEGCVGKPVAAATAAGSATVSSSAVVPSSTSLLTSVAPTRVVPAVTSTAAAAPGSDCHTHADGTLHCV